MKNSMMMIAVISAFGMTAVSHAQTQQKAGHDRAEYVDSAKKCVGLSGDARTACLKDAQQQGKGDMKSAPKTLDTRK